MAMLLLSGLGVARAQDVDGLTPIGAPEQKTARLWELTFRSSVLGGPNGIGGSNSDQTRVRVLLPEGYAAEAAQRYPVIYLYHGGLSDYTSWSTRGGDVEAWTAGQPVIVVMPDGGQLGMYSNWYNNGAFGPPEWETYHMEQLIPWIDAHYRTIPERWARATAGLSMGGGGFRYAAQHPDLIGLTASFSGVIDVLHNDDRATAIYAISWGPRETQELHRRGSNGLDLAKNLAGTDIWIFTGDADPPESTYILAGSRSVHDRLTALNIEHRFTLYPGLRHDWVNWRRAFHEWLPHVMERFTNVERRVPTPTAFSYSSIEPTFHQYGWTVAVERAAPEFAALEVADAQRFDVVGSGAASVTTPPLGAPRAAFTVRVEGRRRAAPVVIQTDAEGRLSIPVALGPANPHQQYSPEANAASTGPSRDQVPFVLLNNGSRFYRTRVTLSATPEGLCQMARSMNAQAGEALCGAMADYADTSSRARRASALRTFRDGVSGRIGQGLTQHQADALLGWAATL